MDHHTVHHQRIISFFSFCVICLCGRTIELRTTTSDGTTTPQPAGKQKLWVIG